MNVIIIIPARMSSSRLPGKPLIDIKGKTLIQRVYENVQKYTKFPVYVAAGEKEIVNNIKKIGGQAILTNPNLSSGSDRIAEALKIIDPEEKYDIVVNFQGDSINVNPDIINQLVNLLIKTKADITTPCIIMDKKDYKDPGCVKLIAPLNENNKEARCLYFTRAIAPYDRDGNGKVLQDIYHHIGIYAYKAQSLKKFVKANEGILEKREKLEQLRALENNMTIFAKIINKLKINNEAPADIDTKEDLQSFIKHI